MTAADIPRKAKPQKAPINKFSRAPRDRFKIDRDGGVLHQILLALNPEGDTPALPTSWLPTVLHHEPKYVRQLACDAARQPYEFTGRRDYLQKSSIIWRMPDGDDLLIEQGYLTRVATPRGDQLEHRVQDSINFLSIANGVHKYPDIELVNWDSVITRPSTPGAIKASLKPFNMELPSGKIVKPDGRPFVIRHAVDGAMGFFKETDRGTEDTGGQAHVTYEKKVQDWIAVLESSLPLKQYGFPVSKMLFITTSVEKEWIFHTVLERVLKRRLCPHILTKHVPDFHTSNISVQPHTKLIDEPWHRYRCKDFSLATLRDCGPMAADPFHNYAQYQADKRAAREARRKGVK